MYRTFIKGKNGHALVHLTPSSHLGYSSPGEKVGNWTITYDYLYHTIERLMPNIQKLDVTEKIEVIMLANLFEEDRPELINIKKALEQKGITKIKIEILPFRNTMVAYLPEEEPDQLLVIGKPVGYFGKSPDLTVKSENQINWLPLQTDKMGKPYHYQNDPESIAIPQIQRASLEDAWKAFE